MLIEKVAKLLNEQVNKEFYSAYLYLSFSNFYKDLGLDGFANWYNVQAQEERDHAMLFIQYMQNNDVPVTLEAIDKPDAELKEKMDALKAGYAHEQYVTSLIHNIYEAAYEVKDFRTMQFLDWFVKEQGEEETNASDLIKKMELFGDDAKSLYMLDQELGGRAYTAPSLVLQMVRTLFDYWIHRRHSIRRRLSSRESAPYVMVFFLLFSAFFYSYCAVQLTGSYPASFTASISTWSATSSVRETVAVFFSRSTWALSTPATPARAFSTCILQCSHIIPSTTSVFFIITIPFSSSLLSTPERSGMFSVESVFSLSSSAFAGPFVFPPVAGLKNRSRSALVTTHTEERLMAAEPIIGLRRRPKAGNRAPAATGMPRRL